MKISVIVPVYNVENYLSTCLDSLLDQGLGVHEYEIILINDGSKDGSLDICNLYAKAHSNIHVYSQENQGVSMARNLGLSKAEGEWILFMDSDDYLCKKSLSYLLSHFCSGEYDAIRFWIRIIDDGKSKKEMSCVGDAYYIGSGYEYIEKYGLETFCCTTLYRRSFLEAHRICFMPYKMGEDFLFASECLLANPRICSTSCKVYQYLIHTNSASTSRRKSHSRACAYDHLAANDRLLDIMDKSNLMSINPNVYNKSIESIQGKYSLIFSRILTSDISSKEFKQIINNQKKRGLLPLPKRESNFKSSFTALGINILVSFPFLFLLAKIIYSYLFVPFILKKMDRNK